jgi:hypothetical protein
MKNNIRLSLLLIFVFIATILFGFVNKLTAPRILSNEELLINGFYSATGAHSALGLQLREGRWLLLHKIRLTGQMDNNVLWF